MTDIPLIPIKEGSEDLAPEFALSAWCGDNGERDQVNLLVHTTQAPRASRHASIPLLYGMAILMLDQQGKIADLIESILEKGPISEAAAVEAIELMLKEDANDILT